MASFDDGPLRSPKGYLYTAPSIFQEGVPPPVLLVGGMFHQSGARREVRVVDVVVVQGAIRVDVVRVVGVGVRGAQAPVDGANRPYPNTRKRGYLFRVSCFETRCWSLLYQAAHI